jgi:hypothetical protein
MQTDTKEDSIQVAVSAGDHTGDIKLLVKDAIREYINFEQARSEPAYKTELIEERRRRETLERRVNELAEENRRSREVAEEAERSGAIRNELQKLGVAKVDLAFKAVRDDIVRAEDGRLVVKGTQGDLSVREYLANFVTENPELLPARISGGSGSSASTKHVHAVNPAIDIDRIKPGMNPEEMERIRQEIARVALQAMKGL